MAHFWRENKMLEKDGISRRTFRDYARVDDVSMRTPIGTQVGPKVGEAKQIAKIAKKARQAKRLLEKDRAKRERDVFELQRQRQQQKGTRERKRYKHMLLDFIDCSQYTPAAQRKFEQDYWEQKLPLHCADEGSLAKERKWLLRCGETLGSLSEVCYVGPNANKSTNDGIARRNQMADKIDLFKAIQGRQTLSLTKSGVSTAKLMVTIDTLLGKFDHQLESHGLECSNLRPKLREIHHLRLKELQELRQSGRTPDVPRNKAYYDPTRIPDLDIPKDVRTELCMEMRSDINKEEAFYEAIINAARMASREEEVDGVLEPSKEELAKCGMDGQCLIKELTGEGPLPRHEEINDEAQLAARYAKEDANKEPEESDPEDGMALNIVS